MEHRRLACGLRSNAPTLQRSSDARARFRSLLLLLRLAFSAFSASPLRAQSESSPDADGYEDNSSQSYISASLTAPGGTTDISSGTSCQMDLSVTRHFWEVWTHSSGDTRYKAQGSEPVSNGLYNTVVELQGPGLFNSSIH